MRLGSGLTRARSSASAPATGPLPSTVTSASGALAFILDPCPTSSGTALELPVAHDGFDLIGRHRYIAGDQLTTVGSDHGVVFGANADVPEFGGYVVGGAHINARLDGKHHSRLEGSPTALAVVVATTVIAHVMHIEPQPVAGTMHIKA